VNLPALPMLLRSNAQADRVVPPSGFTARLTVFSAAAMAFLAVFAMALSFATGRLADRWSEELARTATVRISAPDGQIAAQTAAVLDVLQTTPGVASARALDQSEERKLLEPWFGPDLPLDALPIPQLVEIIETADGLDAEGLRLRLQAEAPGAVFDDHTRWRKPLVAAAERIRMLGLVAITLIAATTAAMVALAANSALAANGQVIRVLRLVGARDTYIARAFVRRFTLRALSGATVGTILGAIVIALMPKSQTANGFLTGLGFQGGEWLWLFIVPVIAAVVAFFATRIASFRSLRKLT